QGNRPRRNSHGACSQKDGASKLSCPRPLVLTGPMLSQKGDSMPEKLTPETIDEAPDITAADYDQAPWPAPKPLPDGLRPVQPLPEALLPTALKPWLCDIAERL